MVKQEKVNKGVIETTVAEKDWKQRVKSLTIIVHLVKRELVSKPVDEITVADKHCTDKESHGKKVQTLVTTLHMVKREKLKVCEELPPEHEHAAGDAHPHEEV